MTTATKTQTNVNPTRKTRTRKVSTKVARSSTVDKVATPKKVEKVTTTPKKVASPKVTPKPVKKVEVTAQTTELLRPEVELISWETYQRDIQNRWNIHHYEMQELAKDVKFIDTFARKDFGKVVKFMRPMFDKGLNLVQPLHEELVTQTQKRLQLN